MNDEPLSTAQEIEKLEAIGYRTIVEVEQRQNVLRQIAARIAELKSAPRQAASEPEAS